MKYALFASSSEWDQFKLISVEEKKSGDADEIGNGSTKLCMQGDLP